MATSSKDQNHYRLSGNAQPQCAVANSNEGFFSKMFGNLGIGGRKGVSGNTVLPDSDAEDDVDLDKLLNEMHGSQEPLLIGGSGLGPGVAPGGSSSSQGGCGGPQDHSMPITGHMSDPIGILRAGPGLLPKSISLPLRQVTPDPFPELANSPLTPVGSQIPMDSSRSSPVSPMMRRMGSPHSCPGSRDGSPAMPRAHSQSLHGSREELSWTPSVYKKTMMLFYSDDQNYRSLTIDANMRASDVCHLLVLKNQAVQDKHWVVVERLPKFNLERSLEDHESVYHIHRSWTSSEDNRFYFRKDFRKYELFQNPAQFFPPHMVDTAQLKETEPGGLFTRTERYKNLLLQHLFSTDKVPDIHGYLHLKEGKRSWKKHFFVLRGSGLYYSAKGTSKDPRYLTLLACTSDVNIYTAQGAKKSMGAPTNFCICLKPPYSVSDQKELKLLSAEDEQSQLCWITALRLVKYASQLRTNYLSALKYEDKLINGENKEEKTAEKSPSYVTPRVAMDFTGLGGRVVDDPNEALGVAIEEAQRWRKKIANRKAVSSSPRSESPVPGAVAEGPGGAGGPGGVASAAVGPANSPVMGQPGPGLSAGVHMTQPWFHSGINREEAVNLIKEQGLIDGVFLIRESHSIPNTFVLSLAHNAKVKHCQINQIEVDGEIFFSMDRGQTKFTDLIQLADFYQVNANGLPTNLTHYVTRLL